MLTILVKLACKVLKSTKIPPTYLERPLWSPMDHPPKNISTNGSICCSGSHYQRTHMEEAILMPHSYCPWYFPRIWSQTSTGVGRPQAPRPPIARPRPPHHALEPPTSSSTALRLCSCAKQSLWRRLSLANSICCSGIVILRGSKSSCASRGHATKMQSIGCQLGMEYLESHFHVKLVFESQPFHFFVMSLVVEVGVNHCTRIWQGCSPMTLKLGGHKAQHT